MDLFNLLLIRQRVELEVEKCGKLQQAQQQVQQQKGSWFGGWFGSKNDTEQDKEKDSDICMYTFF